MSSSGRFLLLISCLAVSVWAGSTAWSASVKTNVEVMKELTTGVAEELISGFPPGVSRELKLDPVGRTEVYDFIGDVLAGKLTAEGFRAYAPRAWSPADTLQPSGEERYGGAAALNLEYKVIDFSLRYPTIYRAHLIGGKKVKRAADVNILARLIDPANGLVVWTGEASRTFEDTFSYGAIEEAESGMYDFTKPPRDSRQWGKIVEPVVVSGIIVGLIYLFFSNQGD